MIRVGQRLRDERLRKGMTIEEVARSTRIRAEFISAIERGNYKNLPSGAYVQGFVKNYISFLGLPSRELLAMFRREFDEREYIGVLPESFTNAENIPIRRFHIRRVVSIIALVLVPLLIYTFFQYRSAFLNPALTITSPKENAQVSGLTIPVSGKTEPNVTVTINDIPVLIDSEGSFKKLVTVFAGKSTITVKAANSFGRITIIERQVKVGGR